MKKLAKQLTLALIAVIGIAFAPAPALADQATDGYWCWTGGYPVLQSSMGSVIRFRLNDEWGNQIAEIALVPGKDADFLYAAMAEGVPVEITTRTVPIRDMRNRIVDRGCGWPLKTPQGIWVITDPSATGENHQPQPTEPPIPGGMG